MSNARGCCASLRSVELISSVWIRKCVERFLATACLSKSTFAQMKCDSFAIPIDSHPCDTRADSKPYTYEHFVLSVRRLNVDRSTDPQLGSAIGLWQSVTPSEKSRTVAIFFAVLRKGCLRRIGGTFPSGVKTAIFDTSRRTPLTIEGKRPKGTVIFVLVLSLSGTRTRTRIYGASEYEYHFIEYDLQLALVASGFASVGTGRSCAKIQSARPSTATKPAVDDILHVYTLTLAATVRPRPTFDLPRSSRNDTHRSRRFGRDAAHADRSFCECGKHHARGRSRRGRTNGPRSS